MRRASPTLTALAAALAVTMLPARADAQPEEQTLLHVELAYVGGIGPGSDRALGPGGAASVGVFHSLHYAVLVGARARGSFHTRDEDQGLALRHEDALYTLTGAFRVRLMGSPQEDARGTGLFIELGGGVGLGEALEPWPVVEAGLGWGIPAGDLDVVPAIRFRHVFGDGDSVALGSQLLAGVGLTFGDAR